jgi:hypothetical protein
MPVLVGDSREGLDPSVLDDERVQQFWDGGRRSGRWFADRRNLGLDPPFLYDAYLLFGPSARWERTPRPLESWGSPVIAKTASLRTEIAPYLRE